MFLIPVRNYHRTVLWCISGHNLIVSGETCVNPKHRTKEIVKKRNQWNRKHKWQRKLTHTSFFFFFFERITNLITPTWVSLMPWGVRNLPLVQVWSQVWSLAQEDPWRRKWQPAPVFLPGKSHGQRSLEATVYGVTESWTRLNNTHLSPT